MIDYARIGEAVKYYTARNYKLIEVPWLVSKEAASLAIPEGRTLYESSAGFLPASGEQCFLDMRLKGNLPDGKYVCVTPCFRDEPVLDVLHRQTFMKVELIQMHTTVPYDVDEHLIFMVEDAQRFMACQGLRTMAIHQPPAIFGECYSYDIEHKGIELGSYGVRSYEGHTWVYGTGLAEPRFSQALLRL